MSFSPVQFPAYSDRPDVGFGNPVICPCTERVATVIYSRHSPEAGPLCAALGRLEALDWLGGWQVVVVEHESPAALSIRRDNPWIDDDPQQPYVVLYDSGLRVEGFAVRSVLHLLDRLDQRGFHTLPADASNVVALVAA